MSDSPGWRQKCAVLIPPTNISRIRIPTVPLDTDEDFTGLGSPLERH